MESGDVIKIKLRYERTFWRDKGLSGTVSWRDPTVCSSATHDAGIRRWSSSSPVRLARRWSALAAKPFCAN